MPKVIVSDSSPIIHLSKIGELNLLKELFGEIIIPEVVYRESVIEGKDREDASEIEDQRWIKVQKIGNFDLKKALNMSLDEGEAESIVLSVEKSADLVLIDDYEAREVAIYIQSPDIVHCYSSSWSTNISL